MNKINEYATLKATIKNFEDRMKKEIEDYKKNNDFEAIESQALEQMLADKTKTVATSYGNVTVRETKSYEYPDYWEQEVKKHKLDKKELEKKLLQEGRYSVNTSIQLAGKPKSLTETPKHPKGTMHI